MEEYAINLQRILPTFAVMALWCGVCHAQAGGTVSWSATYPHASVNTVPPNQPWFEVKGVGTPNAQSTISSANLVFVPAGGGLRSVSHLDYDQLGNIGQLDPLGAIVAYRETVPAGSYSVWIEVVFTARGFERDRADQYHKR